MNYRRMLIDDQLNLCIYPGPYCVDSTPEEQKKYYNFAFSDEGYEEALTCLKAVYAQTDWNK